MAAKDKSIARVDLKEPGVSADRLKSLGISLTETSPALSALIQVASSQCNVPASLITLLDTDTQWHKARIGIEETSYPIGQSFCVHAVRNDDVLRVNDASKDSRFENNPLVQAENGIRAYAGVPIRTDEGLPVGAICAISPFPKDWTDQEIELLKSLSLGASKILELEVNEKKLADISAALDRQLETSSLFSFYFDKLQEGIIIQDDKSNILEANPAAAKALGLSLDQLLGKDSFDPDWRISGSDGRELAPENQPSNIALRTGQPVANIILGVDLPDKSKRWINVNSQPIFKDGDTQPFRTATTFVDVTEKREQEIELIKKTEELSQAVSTAQAASAAKSAFLANMSHELRTPLNGIVGVASVLESTELTELQQEIVQLIKTSGEALGKLLNDTLDLSRIEAARFELNPAPFNILEEVKAATDLFQIAATEKKLAFEVDTKKVVCGQIVGDAARIRQITSNLIANAIKFTEEGEVRVQIRSNRLPHNTDYCLLSILVVDTGIGIPYDKKSMLFERFQQGDISITRKFGGTGLGLAISQELAHAMNGNISVRSIPGKGSVFRFAAPLKIAEFYLEQEEPQDLPLSGPEQLNVLVAEDHKANQKMLSLVLQAVGCQFQIVENGQEAVDAFKSGAFDRVILDMHMPVLDGIEAAKKIRHMPGGNDTKILMLTADTTEASTNAALDAGINRLLHKPITAQSLVEGLIS